MTFKGESGVYEQALIPVSDLFNNQISFSFYYLSGNNYIAIDPATINSGQITINAKAKDDALWQPIILNQPIIFNDVNPPNTVAFNGIANFIQLIISENIGSSFYFGPIYISLSIARG